MATKQRQVILAVLTILAVRVLLPFVFRWFHSLGEFVGAN